MSNGARITPDSTGTEVISAMAQGINLAEYRTFESLPRSAWEYIDDMTIRIAKSELVGTADLKATPGVSIPFNGLGASVFTMYATSGMTDATMAMTPDNRGVSDTIDFKPISVPLPVTVKDFPVNTKQVAMALRDGIPLQGILSEEALYRLMYKIEDHLFNGSYTAGGYTSYGYTTHPNRIEHTIPITWTTQEPDLIFKDVNEMCQDSRDINHFGPWVLYIPSQYAVALEKDYTVGSNDYPVNGSVRTRLMQIPELRDIKISKNLANDNVVLVEMNPTTVKLIEGIEPTVVDWTSPAAPTWTHNFKAMAMQVPLFMSDYDDQLAIVHGHL